MKLETLFSAVVAEAEALKAGHQDYMVFANYDPYPVAEGLSRNAARVLVLRYRKEGMDAGAGRSGPGGVYEPLC